jgi:PemK-like, MazF-like toxin of type II toxin-antitoxin system
MTWASVAPEARTMSVISRLSSILRSAARSPEVRRGARRAGRAALRAVQQRQGGPGADGGATPGAQQRGSAPSTRGRTGGPSSAGTDGAGAQALADRSGSRPPTISYAPRGDDHPDPGEIVWAWVPFEEDLSQGKDRPVLVLAEEDASAGGSDGSGEVLIALMLTSRDRADRDQVTTDEHGATWVDIGTGDWDRQGRPSEVRADRLLRILPGSVRREGGRLDQERFDRVADAVRRIDG